MSMHQKIFVAGATGAVGIVLCQLLSRQGYEVFGMTRKEEKSKELLSLNVTPVIADVYDEGKLETIVLDIRPDIVIHQLTDLPFGVPEAKMAEGRIRNAKIRDIGTKNLIAAAVKAGVRRVIAQSIAFMYEDGPKPFDESSPLASEGLRLFENQILHGDIEGIVLRYGRFYGPRTGFSAPSGPGSVHVDAAAYAALLSITNGDGIYNIAEDDGEVSIVRAVRELKWDPSFRT